MAEHRLCEIGCAPQQAIRSRRTQPREGETAGRGPTADTACWRAANTSIGELAKAERINPSYLARVLRLTLLAPDIVECILDGRHESEQVSLDRLVKPFPGSWEQQLSVPSKIGCGRRVICRGQLTFGQARRKPPAANTVLQIRLTGPRTS